MLIRLLTLISLSFFAFAHLSYASTDPIQNAICSERSEPCKIACKAYRTKTLEYVEVLEGKPYARNAENFVKCFSILQSNDSFN